MEPRVDTLQATTGWGSVVVTAVVLLAAGCASSRSGECACDPNVSESEAAASRSAGDTDETGADEGSAASKSGSRERPVLDEMRHAGEADGENSWAAELANLLSEDETAQERRYRQRLGWHLDWKPERLWLTDFKRCGVAYELTGNAHDADDVAELIHRMETAVLWKNTELAYVRPADEEKNGKEVVKFGMRGRIGASTTESQSDSGEERLAAAESGCTLDLLPDETSERSSGDNRSGRAESTAREEADAPLRDAIATRPWANVLQQLRAAVSPPGEVLDEKEMRDRNWNLDWDPSRLWLTRFVQAGAEFEMKGRASQADDVAEWLHRLETLSLLENIQLDYVRPPNDQEKEPETVEFRVTGSLPERSRTPTNSNHPDEGLEAKLVAATRVPAELKNIHDKATRSGLKVRDFQRKEMRRYAEYAEIPVETTVVGSYDDVRAWLSWREMRELAVVVEKLQLDFDPETDGVEANLTLLMYRRPQ